MGFTPLRLNKYGRHISSDHVNNSGVTEKEIDPSYCTRYHGASVVIFGFTRLIIRLRRSVPRRAQHYPNSSLGFYYLFAIIQSISIADNSKSFPTRSCMQNSGTHAIVNIVIVLTLNNRGLRQADCHYASGEIRD